MDAGTEVIISLYFWFISKNWLYLQIYGAFITFLSAFCLYMVPDSPKYLYSKGRYEQARKAFDFIQKFNSRFKQVNKQETFEHIKFDTEIKPEIKNEKAIASGSIKELLADRVHVKNLILFIIQWIVGIYTFYNLFFQLKYFEGDIFTNMIIAGLSEMVSTLVGG